jgi:ornithine decarboxylase
MTVLATLVKVPDEMNKKIARFLADNTPATPCLVVDLDVIGKAYDMLCRYLPIATVYYAVKANPAAAIVSMLVKKGSYFDGATPERLSFGNTIKKERDIISAYAAGVRLFAFDSEAELAKLARSAPGARVFCRILVSCEGADWPLSRKFGCTPELAVKLLCKARDLGLDPYGVSFHVGSQQTDLNQWDGAVASAAQMFSLLAEADINLRMVNIGGGFPARYRAEVSPVEAYAGAVTAALTKHFGNNIPEVIVEPGRSLVGNAGVIQSEVVLISDKGDESGKRWVYLDAGKFNGLAETMDESIKYRIETPGRGGPSGPVVIAGPTCDSADILYEKTEYRMPLELEVGDKVEILSTGAYTSSYASVGFNGFPPMRTYCI